jgi:polysaccharide export outer membrane protein
MRLCRLLVVLLAVLLAACARQPPRQIATAAPAVSHSELDAMTYGRPGPPSHTVTRVSQVVPVRAVPLEDGPYTLDSGDKLRIVVFGQDALSNTYAVDANGMVSMPLIGMVQARGLTTSQLSGAIAAKLKQSFIRDPSVAVEIETYRPFFILGEVTYPGQYPYVARMTAETAVAIAGGFTPRASKGTVTVTRKVQGVPMRFSIPLSYPVRPGDTVTVGERWF